MGGGSVSVPGPSAEERELQREQTELLRQQRDVLSRQLKQQELLAPLLFDAAGVIPIKDEKTGEIVGYEMKKDPTKEKEDAIQSLLLDRTEKALKGELPENPALLRDLGSRESELRERLFKQLGTGFETSTPGIEALEEFNTEKTNILDASRRGDLSLAEGLSLSRQAANAEKTNQLLARATGVSSFQFGGQGGFSQIAQGLGAITGQMQQDRAMALNASIAARASKAQERAALFQGIGTAAGFWAGGGFKLPGA